MTPQEAIGNKALEVCALAKSLYDFDVKVRIFYDLKGLTAGFAVYGTYTIRINLEAYRLAPEETLNETVPHEIAHLVAYWAYGDRGKGHGRVWQLVARSLGCSGKRCHSLKLKPARRHTRYAYQLADGSIVAVGAAQHKRMQAGTSRGVVRKTGEVFTKEQFVKAVDNSIR